MFKKKKTTKTKQSNSHDTIFKQLDALSDDEFNKKFEEMMNELNMRSQDVRLLMLQKDKDAKKDMIAKFLISRGCGVHDVFQTVKTNLASKKKGPSTPSEYATELGKKDISHSSLLSVLGELKISLTTEPLAWTEQFLSNGMDSVFSVMDTVIRAPEFKKIKEMQEVVHECVRCVQAIMNSKDGFRFVLSKDDYIFTLTRCIFPENVQLMTDAIRLVAAISLVSHEKALWGLSYVAREKDIPRFSLLLHGLDYDQPEALQTGSMVLLNALVSGHDDIDLRIHLRCEGARLNMIDKINKLKELEYPRLRTQIVIFEESMESDANEIHEKFYGMQAHINNLDEAYELLKNLNKNTASETYLLSTFQHFLFIREDPLIRTNYYRLIEEVVSQIVLQKNGTDPDFSLRRLNLDVDSLIENMCNEALVAEAKDRMIIAENNYKNEMQQKTELSAKLTVTIKDYEEKVKKLKKAVLSERKAKEKLEKSISEMGSGISVQAGAGSNSVFAGSSAPPPPPGPPPSGPPGAPPPGPPPSGPPGVPPPGPPPSGPPGAPPPGPPPSGPPGVPPPGPPPPGPPPPPGGPPGGPPRAPGGPPPPSGPPGFGVAAPVNPKKKYESAGTKRLNWNQLNASKVKEGSIWKDLHEEELEKTELFDSIKSLFTAKKVGTTLAKSTTGEEKKKKVKMPMVLDGKGVQNLSLFLGAYKMSNEEIVSKFKCSDATLMNENFITNLRKYLPTLEQRSQLEEYRNQLDELPDAELFVLAMNKIKRLDGKLICWEIMLKFPETVGDLKPNITAVLSACQEITGSSKFTELLKLILLIGNYMNAGSRNERTIGFDIRFLQKLQDTKTCDNSMTFLHYLDDTINCHYPSIVGFVNDLSSVSAASKVSDDLIGRTIKKLDASIQQVTKEAELSKKVDDPADKFVASAEAFLSDATTEVNVIKEMYSSMTESFKKLIVYLSLDPSVSTTEECFSIIAKFVDDFRKAATENKLRIEREEKERKNKMLKEAEQKMKEMKAQLLEKKKNNSKEEEPEGVIDGLLTSLESGTAFKQEAAMKKKSAKPKVDYRKERTRTMGKNAQALFSAMMGEQAKEFEKMDL